MITAKQASTDVALWQAVQRGEATVETWLIGFHGTVRVTITEIAMEQPDCYVLMATNGVDYTVSGDCHLMVKR